MAVSSVVIRVGIGITVLAVAIAGCAASGSVLPVVKIGLIAPFEGPERNMAYETLLATKLAIKHYNEVNRAAGPLVELVALNDNGWPENAPQQAREMVIDPAVLGVIGPWTADGATYAQEVYQAAGLAALFPGDDASGLSASEDTSAPGTRPGNGAVDGGDAFTREFEELTGKLPTSQAIFAYNAANVLLSAVQAASSRSDLTRREVREQVMTAEAVSWRPSTR